jgi:hypothetical protein
MEYETCASYLRSNFWFPCQKTQRWRFGIYKKLMKELTVLRQSDNMQDLSLQQSKEKAFFSLEECKALFGLGISQEKWAKQAENFKLGNGTTVKTKNLSLFGNFFTILKKYIIIHLENGIFDIFGSVYSFLPARIWRGYCSSQMQA